MENVGGWSRQRERLVVQQRLLQNVRVHPKPLQVRTVSRNGVLLQPKDNADWNPSKVSVTLSFFKRKSGKKGLI